MLIDLRIDMAVDDQQILPSVVVVVQKSVAESHKRQCRRRHARPVAHVGQSCRVPSLRIDDIVVIGEFGVHQVQVAVVLVVPRGDAHV